MSLRDRLWFLRWERPQLLSFKAPVFAADHINLPLNPQGLTKATLRDTEDRCGLLLPLLLGKLRKGYLVHGLCSMVYPCRAVLPMVLHTSTPLVFA